MSIEDEMLEQEQTELEQEQTELEGQEPQQAAEEAVALDVEYNLKDLVDKDTTTVEEIGRIEETFKKHNLTSEQGREVFKDLTEVGKNVLQQRQEEYNQQLTDTNAKLKATYGQSFTAKHKLLRDYAAKHMSQSGNEALANALSVNPELYTFVLNLIEKTQPRPFVKGTTTPDIKTQLDRMYSDPATFKAYSDSSHPDHLRVKNLMSNLWRQKVVKERSK